jgi:regulator of Ty1 transposition protein 103
MPEAFQTAYRSSTPEIQNKLKRVLEVWKTRVTFEATILDAVDARLEEADKSKGGSGGKKTLMGKSLFSSSSDKPMPKELETLGPLQIAVTKATIDARPSIDSAQKDYTALNDPEATLPTPPVYAAKLSGLIKQLSHAETAVSASIKARQELVADLERILEINKSALTKDEETFLDLGSRKTSTEAKKRDVEDAIMRGLSGSDGDGETSDLAGGDAYDRPEVEELTPEPEQVSSNPAIAAALSGLDDTGYIPGKVRQASNSSLNGQSAKRRKMSHGDDHVVPDLGAMGMENLGREGESVGSLLGSLDADVNELIEHAKQQ